MTQDKFTNPESICLNWHNAWHATLLKVKDKIYPKTQSLSEHNLQIILLYKLQVVENNQIKLNAHKMICSFFYPLIQTAKKSLFRIRVIILVLLVLIRDYMTSDEEYSLRHWKHAKHLLVEALQKQPLTS